MSARTPSQARAAAEWTRRTERGALPLIRFMVWLSRVAGRRATRAPLHLVTAYFVAFGARARRASRDYLTRCLGRAPTLAETYRHFLAFASTLHDRVYFLQGRFELFEIGVEGGQLLREGEGALLMGAHVGSFEALRACGRGLAHRRVVMAMYGDNAQKVRSALAALDPGAASEVIALGHLDSMLALRERLEAGALVGVLADRTLGDEPVLELDFLGARAPFPVGPMRLAAALRQRVVFMAGLYLGGNRYAIRFEEIADFAGLDGAARGEREARVREAVARYAACLERHCRAAPYNFFNFHRFWR